jgi:hypothetical protein
MRYRLGLLGTATTLVLAAAVVTAGPAEARRNLGGSEPGADICVLPGNAGIQSDHKGLGAICVCVRIPGGGMQRNVGTDPNGPCPPGITRLQ